MSNKTIADYTAAVAIDGSNDYLLIEPSGNTVYKKINRTTLLGISGAPVGTTDSQALTNKTIGNTNTVTLKDTLFTLQDDGDVAKQAQFQLSGITTGNTRTLTVPDASLTLVGTATTQTLTNKTITSPTITGGTIDNSTITVDSIAGHSSASTVAVAGLTITSGALATSSSVPTAAIQASAVTSAKINFGGAGAGVWWEEIGRTTLGSGGDVITVSGLGARKYLRMYISLLATGGTINPNLTFNNDSGSNYSASRSTDFAGASTVTSQANLSLGGTATAEEQFIVIDVINITAQEKLVLVNMEGGNTTGAGTAPQGRQIRGKWANTAAQISRVDITNAGTGDYATGSEVIVMGHN